jgi:hypothetical protein
MHQRKWLRAIPMISCFAGVLAAQEAAPASAPAPMEAVPGQTIKVPDHRSKWDYPKEVTIPPGAQLHVVEKGDTLWDLGNKYLGNPYAWPQIWELNKWITDPHWIYPSDYLLVPSGRQAVSLQGDVPPEVANLQPDRKFRLRPAQDEYSFTFQDFIQLPYLVPKGAKAHFTEIGAVRIADRKHTERTQLGEGEEIYLDGGAGRGIKIGDRLLILKVLKKDLYAPNDPRHRHNLGDVIKQIGVARVTQADDKSSVALIEKAMDAVEVGDHLAAFTEPASLQTKLRTNIAEPVPLQAPTAMVIYVPELHTFNGPGEMLIIDQGLKDGLKVGDLLLGVQKHTWVVGKDSKGKDIQASTTSYLAQMLVVKVQEASSTCRVLRGQKEILVGDIVTR